MDKTSYKIVEINGEKIQLVKSPSLWHIECIVNYSVSKDPSIFYLSVPKTLFNDMKKMIKFFKEKLDCEADLRRISMCIYENIQDIRNSRSKIPKWYKDCNGKILFNDWYTPEVKRFEKLNSVEETESGY